jgi:hypothetical protein
VKALWKQGVTGCLLSLVAWSACAETVSVKNNSPYPVEVSGSVSVTTDRTLLPPAERAQLDMQPNSVTHLMLIAPGSSGYQDNILVKMDDGDLSATPLYGKESVTVDHKHIVLER